MSTKVSLVVQEINRNQQSSMHKSQKIMDNFNTDTVFAKNIYEFLNGKTGDVLERDSIKRIIEKAETDIVSIGYGVSINKNLEIRITKPINNYVSERLDIITPEIHEAYITYLNIDKCDDEIDIEKDNTYDINRIHILQEYLKEYFLEEDLETEKRKAL